MKPDNLYSCRFIGNPRYCCIGISQWLCPEWRMVNGKSFYGYKLPLGSDYGGRYSLPLFFSGLDPRNLSDNYANYWEQNVNHTLINWAYCADNPKNYAGYSSESWGLTASDNHEGYSAHSPTHDLGVITPTAAVSALPYTPELSKNAIRCFIICWETSSGVNMVFMMPLISPSNGGLTHTWLLTRAR